MNKYQFRIGETDDGKVVKLDLDTFVDTRGFLVANSGGGKSNAFRLIVEQTIEHVPWIIIDVDGEYGVMRKAFPNILLVGENGELPVDVRSAGKLAQKIVELRVSTIIDLYGLLKIRPEWCAHFLDALIHLKKSLWLDLIVGVDEAQTIAPPPNEIKGDKKYREDLFAARDAMIQLASQGRKQSRGSLVATQRTSKLDSNVRAELRNRFIGLSSQKLDRANNADELGLDKKAAVELQGLPAGVFHGFGPAFVNQRGIVLFRFDLAQTKEAPRKERNAPPPASDAIYQIVNQIGDLPKQVQEEGDALTTAQRQAVELQRERDALKRQLEARPIQVQAQVETKIERVEVPIFRNGDLNEMKEIVQGLGDLGSKLLTASQGIKSSLDGAARAVEVARTMNFLPKVAPRVALAMSSPVAISPRPARVARVIQSDGAAASDLPKQLQIILNVLASFEALGETQAWRNNVAVLVGLSPNSGGINNNVGALRNKDGVHPWQSLIEYPSGSVLALTEAGRASAVAQGLTLEMLQEAWYRVLQKKGAKYAAVARLLVDAHPQAISRDDIARAAELAPGSGGINNIFGYLHNTVECVKYHGKSTVSASEKMFPEGLR